MPDLLMSNLPAQFGILGVVFLMFFWLLKKVMNDASEREAKLMAFNKELARAINEQTKIIDKVNDTLAMQGERLQELACIIERMQESVASLHDRVERLSEQVRGA